MKELDLIRFLWYTKYVNKLNTGTGVSTEVSLPSGSGEEISVDSNYVVNTKNTAEKDTPSAVFFIQVAGLVYHHTLALYAPKWHHLSLTNNATVLILLKTRSRHKKFKENS